MPDRMEIGHDLDLFLDTARLVIGRRTWSGGSWKAITQNSVQRHVRVGWVKASRLLRLLDDFDIVASLDGSIERFTCAIDAEEMDAKLAEIRAAHREEVGHA